LPIHKINISWSFRSPLWLEHIVSVF
jgi:hypothetical protein